MGRIMDLVEQWERDREKPAPGTIDGHEVATIILETERMVVFKDPEGNLWRRVHAWGQTWPVIIQAGKQ